MSSCWMQQSRNIKSALRVVPRASINNNYNYLAVIFVAKQPVDDSVVLSSSGMGTLLAVEYSRPARVPRVGQSIMMMICSSSRLYYMPQLLFNDVLQCNFVSYVVHYTLDCDTILLLVSSLSILKSDESFPIFVLASGLFSPIASYPTTDNSSITIITSYYWTHQNTRHHLEFIDSTYNRSCESSKELYWQYQPNKELDRQSHHSSRQVITCISSQQLSHGMALARISTVEVFLISLITI